MSQENRRPLVEEPDGSGVNPTFIVGGGEMGALIRAIDWEATPLGPMGTWPQSLRTALSICLSSRFPIVIFWGPDLVMLYNDAYLPIPGGKHPASMGRPGLEVWEEIRDVIGPMLRGVISTGEATWSEDLMLPIVRDGAPSESYFTFTYSPIRDESGGVGGVFCAVVETTVRVIEERRLRLLNSLAEATRARTPEEACAHAAARIAQAPDDVPFALIYLLDDAARVARLAGVANIEAGTSRSPTTIPFGDASTWPFDELEPLHAPRFVELEDLPHAGGAMILPIERSGGGRPFGFIVAGLAPLLPHSESYDRFHKLLSASISQAVSSAAAYEEERKRAEALAALDRAKTTFFSNVSHEFRTPLTLLLGPASDALAEADLTARDRERWQLVHGNAQRLQKLVNTLLDFSRIEAGRAQARYRPTDLASLTVDLASAFRSAIERAGLAFQVDCPPLPSAIYVDQDMWEKIVLNLLSNALKFTHEGTIAIALRWRDDRAELIVRDSGAGIPEKDLPHLFERFHRVEGTRARTHEGSGIGLALVQELVRLHGGSIRANSVVGQGTALTVVLPAGASHLPADRVERETSPTPLTSNADAYVNEAFRWLPEASRPGTASQTASESGPSVALPLLLDRRILVADDNPDMRSYVARILRTHWRVDTVENGEAALEKLREGPYDLVLSDVMMPGIDGFALLRAVRSDARLAGLPVILLSARAGEESRVEGLHAGADDYLVKPFSARELLARVSTHLALGRARKESERASLAKDEFLATASHELRTPLNSILGWARLLRAGQLDAASHARALDTIERNAKSQVRLVEDILDGSRIITGKLHLEIRPLDMATLVSAAMEALRPAAEAKNIHVSVAVDPLAAKIVGDPERLQQVVWNLANNAIKFTPKGGSVDVRLERKAASIELSVADSGQGISPEFLPHVFERFRQAEGSFSRRHGGLGLGLALVRHLVEAHGGTVRAESAGAGRGARFVATLPVQAVYEHTRSDPPPRLVASDEGGPLPRLNGVSVLIVDDERDARDLVAHLLRAQGADVTVASSAEHALEVLSTTSQMVLVSDVGMPGTDGYELMGRVRNLTGSKQAQIPAIALTAYAREDDRRRALEAGFQSYVAKPVEPAELVRAVSRLVHGSPKREGQP